jgi:serine/threonine protein phosphatase PrpC
MMRLSVAKRSECGGRKANEDTADFCADETQGCFVMADGAGGHKGGAIASSAVVRQVLAHFSATPRIDAGAINTLMRIARESLLDTRMLYPEYPEMNTTIATLMLDTKRAYAYWNYLGDSRIYLFRDGHARSLTNDHSVLQSMIDAGLLTGDPRGNCKRNMLYAAVGCDEVPGDAVCDEPLALQAGDIFLLCTDGFWESIAEDTMEAALRRASSPGQWIDDMMRELPDPESPGQDNYSAIAVWVGDRMG